MNTTLQTPCGFTLIELLVVMTIIGVVSGLLLSAMEKVRKTANRTLNTFFPPVSLGIFTAN